MRFLILSLLLSSCSHIGIDLTNDDQTIRKVVKDRPTQIPPNDQGISLYDQHHRFTFFMKIDRTVTFENAHRAQNEIAGRKDNSRLGNSCKMQRVVGAYTRDILIVENKPRMFRLMRSVTTGQREARPIIIAVDVKSGDTTYEIHCPNVGQYNTAILKDNFGFEVIAEEKKLKENFI